MARGRRRVVENTPESIKEQISMIDADIETKTQEIKTLKIKKKELAKDLIIAEKNAAIEKEQAEMKALVVLMKEKNLTTEDIEKILTESK